MLDIVLNVSIIILLISSICVDTKRIKVTKELTKVDRNLEEKLVEFRSEIQCKLRSQKEHTISFDELVEEVRKRIIENIKKSNSMK
ncbi:hypothetical protein Ccar_16580 [Clostridium carboxidivorans P7]|uniref:hypothetical protein n=1 Tax=Clostridium carboxidivorans TaxID=217159 RepID=UPI00064EFDBC|nr:hypothetical protein [Clostridium carboxidivorans]AKN32389.1 hypothetical protein Ccar_16580 [Clostridium carboxidivorans P7]